MTVTDAVDSGYEPKTVGGKWAEGLTAVRAAHRSLRRSVADAAPDDKRRQIQDFLDDTCKAGAFIGGIGDRRDAQNILDYWFGELASLRPPAPDLPKGPHDFAAKLLAPFDPTRASLAERTSARSEEEQKELIRLSAYARQYMSSDKDRGYLLSGDALEDAARFKDQDKNIAALVKASETAAGHKKIVVATNRTFIAFLVFPLVFILLISFFIRGVGYWITTQVQTSGGSFVKTIYGSVGGNTDATFDLRLLDLFQPLSGPYDLSATSSEFANIKLPELRLYAPNFTGVNFRNVAFPNAKLPVASFTKSVFMTEGQGGRKNDFGGADLERSQFRGADIASTSFQGADLFRAVFDRAVLREVDFAGANLRAASFWATTLDQSTRLSLQETAWWLAVGWQWSEIQSLRASATETDAGKNRVRLQFLKTSPGFKKDMKEPTDGFKRSLSGSLEKARALNWIAWTYAVWGLCISEPGGARPGIDWYPELCTADPPAEGFPVSARDAALQAVKTVAELIRASGKDATKADFLANLKDTLAYVYMQSGEMPKALETFKEIEKDSPQTFESAETSFRYAIALYNQGDRVAAVERFEKAIFEKRYQPTHELQTLKTYIFGNEKFESCLEESTELLWPTSKLLSPSDLAPPKQGAQERTECHKAPSVP